ncbi:sulfotransferase domain-containing protein [Myxosarcina sp. GI1]|uniref:sulfotransferase domain-containing protein n=1 Tax=Myxosarcina sp. GI1 TaxID=1541065 RepID=UPI00055D0A86|nr:sulfotransferase domain-containing protein [Myxosarcina sp. GI1]
MTVDNFALIIGTMKGGTTSLFNYLAQHPQAAPCNYKEPNFFAYQSNFNKGFDYYQSLWNWRSDTHKIAVEASVNYTRTSLTDVMNSAENIAKYKDRAKFKFIYILRNPIDRIESHYAHGIAYKTKKNPDRTTQALDKEILDTSKYAKQIAEYYQRFSSENILLLNFDDLKQNPLNLMQKVCQFLEIDSDYQFQNLNSIYNDGGNKKIRVNWYGLNIPMKAKIHRLLRQIPSSYKQPLHNLLGGKTHNNFTLSQEQKDYIVRELAADLRSLNQTYGFDISRWGLNLKTPALEK